MHRCDIEEQEVEAEAKQTAQEWCVDTISICFHNACSCYHDKVFAPPTGSSQIYLYLEYLQTLCSDYL